MQTLRIIIVDGDTHTAQPCAFFRIAIASFLARTPAERAHFCFCFARGAREFGTKSADKMRVFHFRTVASSSAMATHTRRNPAQFFAPKSHVFCGARQPNARIFAFVLRAARASSLQFLLKRCASFHAKVSHHRRRRRCTRGATPRNLPDRNRTLLG